jgi:hypothetical protein
MSVIGRLFITCQNVTLNSLSQAILPQLFFRLDNHESVSRAEADKVITIDLSSQPEDLDLFIELRNDTSGESIGSAKYNIADVLRSGQESCITLDFSRSDDKTVVSTINFKLAFVQAKKGSIKLRLGAENSNDDTRVVLSLPMANLQLWLIKRYHFWLILTIVSGISLCKFTNAMLPSGMEN